MHVSNQEIAKILSEIGEYLEMQDVAFKPRAYEKVAEAIGSLQEEVSEIYKRGGLKALEALPGVGTSIAEHIEELLKTGSLKYYERLKKQTPVDLGALSGVEGLGPKKIKALYKKLGVKNLKDLERAAKSGKIAKLPGFGPKSADNIMKGVGFVKRSGGRFLLGYALPEIREIERRLRLLKGVERAEVAGSVRRWKETIGDADFLIVSDAPKPVMDFFVRMPEVARVLAKGETKSSVKLKSGMDVDVRVVPRESYGAALNYFTGSKDHNIALRKLAIEKGWKLNEYGLYADSRRLNADGRRKISADPRFIREDQREMMIAGKTEEDIYEKLGLDYIEPEMREMTGEIEASRKHTLPRLIGYGDLMGDLQTQTNWTDGDHSIEEMAESAMKFGLQYIAITDHTKRLAMARGLDARRLSQQMKEIDAVNQKLQRANRKFKVLKGTECDILKDGAMDLPDEILKQLDVVGGSVHSLFHLSRDEQTERMKRAMRNPNVDIIFHPTGRLINRRAPYEVDVQELITAAKATNTILEIDAYPDRLDLKDEYIRKCAEAGVKMSIDSDAHAAEHFSLLEFGIAQARRGWAEKRDIINTRPVEQMLKTLKNGRI